MLVCWQPNGSARVSAMVTALLISYTAGRLVFHSPSPPPRFRFPRAYPASGAVERFRAACPRERIAPHAAVDANFLFHFCALPLSCLAAVQPFRQLLAGGGGGANCTFGGNESFVQLSAYLMIVLSRLHRCLPFCARHLEGRLWADEGSPTLRTPGDDNAPAPHLPHPQPPPAFPNPLTSAPIHHFQEPLMKRTSALLRTDDPDSAAHAGEAVELENT